jgi:hypothetical protein
MIGAPDLPFRMCLQRHQRSSYPQRVNINWGKFDWVGFAAVAAVLVTVVTAAANGYVARDRWKRVERLTSILKDLKDGTVEARLTRVMLFSELQRLDYQLRATGWRVVLVVGWVARVVGWLAILAGYIVASVALRPWLSGEMDWSMAAWSAVPFTVWVLALPGAVLVVGSIMLFNTLYVGRKKWMTDHASEAAPGS